MATYRIDRRCGHSETVRLGGGRKHQVAYEEGKLCYECYRAEIEASRVAESEAAAATAREEGWAALSGTERQVAWAERIRRDCLSRVALDAASADEHEAEARPRVDYRPRPSSREWAAMAEATEACPTERRCVARQAVARAVYDHLAARTSAKWWIDNETHGDHVRVAVEERIGAVVRALRAVAAGADALDAVRQAEIAAEVSQESRPSLVARPPAPTKGDTPVRIEIQGGAVWVEHPRKDDDLYRIVKPVGAWDPARSAWRILKNPFQASEDAAAEIGARALAAGFLVEAPSEDVVERMAGGGYAPYPPRRCEKRGEGFAVSWEGRDDDLYQAFRRLAGSRFEAGVGIKVPATAWEDVDGLCERYGMAMSPGARGIVDDARARYRPSVTLEPVLATADGGPSRGRPDLDPMDATVSEDLLDD